MAEKSEKEIRFDVFKAYLDDLGRIGGRHETLRQYYITVVSALASFLSLAGGQGMLQGVQQGTTVVGLAGILVCLAWFLHMRSFAAIFKAKIATLRHIESGLPVEPFAKEDSVLEKTKSRDLTTADRFLALALHRPVRVGSSV